MADPKELAKLLEAHIIGTTEWRVANPKTGDFCMSFSRRDTMHPEAAAREWLRDHRQRFPASPFASYEVREVTYYSGLEQIALQVVDYLNSTPGVNPCEAPSITDDEAVTLAIGVGGALFSGNAGNERTYIMSRSDIGRFARAVQKGSTSGVNASDGSRRGEA